MSEIGCPELKESIAAINRFYDTQMFRTSLRWSGRAGNGDFHNWGYWEWNTRSRIEACENLVERLLLFIPEKKGSILDVACGKGATTRHLLEYYKSEDVIGINISEKQLRRCKVNAPECKFLLMNAVQLAFADNSFDDLICVESAFHFVTRQRFLEEAYRVLKPGGCLVLSDILRTRWSAAGSRLGTVKNYVRNLETYRALYQNAGFEHIQMIDATHECWIRFLRRSLRFIRRRILRKELDWANLRRLQSYFYWTRLAVRHYLLICAQKPEPGHDRPISYSGSPSIIYDGRLSHARPAPSDVWSA
jgi:MPBQ/MSBQ methyltransferase